MDMSEYIAEQCPYKIGDTVEVVKVKGFEDTLLVNVPNEDFFVLRMTVNAELRNVTITDVLVLYSIKDNTAAFMYKIDDGGIIGFIDYEEMKKRGK